MPDLRLGYAFVLELPFRPVEALVGRGNGGAGAHDDESNTAHERRGERTDPTALAPPEQADPVGRDVSPAAQEPDRGGGVSGEVLQRSRLQITRRSSRAPLVIGEDGEAPAQKALAWAFQTGWS